MVDPEFSECALVIREILTMFFRVPWSVQFWRNGQVHFIARVADLEEAAENFEIEHAEGFPGLVAPPQPESP